jgi:hypothetical protein
MSGSSAFGTGSNFSRPIDRAVRMISDQIGGVDFVCRMAHGVLAIGSAEVV